MQTKEFKAESKRLLDMMINSIYTHKEIFLREIISNASDAIDKLYFKSLTDTSVGMKKSDFAINIAIDKENRTLTVSDNGIGMTEEDLENNLGTIANSGSFAFKKDNDLGDDVDIIGQFGVGFYSTFMVAKEVTVVTKAFGSDQAYKWTSDGVEGYTIEECDKPDGVGTTITLKLKDDTDDEKYSTYLDQYQIQSLVKKYSDYIRFPIRMEVEHTHYNEEGKEPEVHKAIETLNSMTPIWKKNKSELKDEDYNNFYMEKFGDYEPPVAHIHSKNEGVATYDALLYIPARAPFDYYSKDYEKGLQLYSSGVMIMEKCADLLPDWFSFVKGVVDSEDLSLNISRELLQQDRQLKIIAKNLEKSIKNELAKLLKNDREKYEKFYSVFGLQFKFGIYQSYGAANETLKDLLMFPSSFDGKNVTLKEYVSRMKEDQKEIYYACGETKERIEMLPQLEKIKDKGYEVLYFTQDVDEFAIKVMINYDGKPFKSISDADLDLDTEEEKEEAKKLDEENKDMFTFMQEAIADKVKTVRLSKKLKTHPVCLSSDGSITIEMEKVLNAMPQNDGNKVKAEKALETIDCEFAQHHLGESILKVAQVTDEEYLKLFREANPYNIRWSDDFVLAKIAKV
jgi:molecular chaperone HtpG